ncbi:ALQxL family class IV lanthipeptide [Streptosporangium amethystogenes]|nr:ALQxL family class IV lanthipeptide [Streptosporangium amethystogenes]
MELDINVLDMLPAPQESGLYPCAPYTCYYYTCGPNHTWV